jgi:hypothetical protein
VDGFVSFRIVDDWMAVSFRWDVSLPNPIFNFSLTKATKMVWAIGEKADLWVLFF